MTKSHISFSVVMPVYHGDNPQHVAEALESLGQQTLLANETVVVQDGPVPESLTNVLAEYNDIIEGFNWVVLKENKGLSNALNAGIDAAKHEWLARMDADDICLPTRFEEQVARIEKETNLSIIGSWITEYDEEMNNQVGIRRLPETHEEILSYAKWRCPFNHMTVMYRKSVLEKLGKYKNYGAVGDDYELWARFLTKGYQSANLQKTLVKARTGSDFFSNRRRGLTYFKNELREINDLYRLGLLNPLHYVFHFTVKAVVRLSPPGLVKWIYKGIRKTS